MGKRRDEYDERQAEMAFTRRMNGPRKAAARQRRDARMRTAIQAAKPPYTRFQRNWLAEQLGKSEAQITPADVQKVLQAKA